MPDQSRVSPEMPSLIQWRMVCAKPMYLHNIAYEVSTIACHNLAGISIPWNGAWDLGHVHTHVGFCAAPPVNCSGLYPDWPCNERSRSDNRDRRKQMCSHGCNQNDREAAGVRGTTARHSAAT